jgi:AhpD family alkylhydroperoxidase
MTNPALLVPDALPALMALGGVVKKSGLPARTLHLVSLRASQINGCSLCVELHVRDLRKLQETDERLFAVSAWREAPYFTEAERAALALTEAVTRLSDRADAVPDEVWAEAALHYDEPLLAALVLNISFINAANRMNVATRQLAGSDLQFQRAQSAV